MQPRHNEAKTGRPYLALRHFQFFEQWRPNHPANQLGNARGVPGPAKAHHYLCAGAVPPRVEGSLEKNDLYFLVVLNTRSINLTNDSSAGLNFSLVLKTVNNLIDG